MKNIETKATLARDAPGSKDPRDPGIFSFQTPRSQGLKLLADSGETALLEPSVLKPAEVQEPLAAEPEEVRNRVVAAQIPPDRPESHDRELPLDVVELSPEGQELGKGRGTQTHLVELEERVLGLDDTVEVHELDVDIQHAFALHREVLGSDVVVLPVVLASRDYLLEGETVVDRDGIGDRDGSFEDTLVRHDNASFLRLWRILAYLFIPHHARMKGLPLVTAFNSFLV